MSNTENTDSGIEKKKIHKIELAKRLYFLNRYIGELIGQREKSSDKLSLQNLNVEIKKLYCLKNKVMLKMIANGNAHICFIQKSQQRSYYVVRINSTYSFHLPLTRNIKRMFDEKTTEKIYNSESETQNI